MENEEIYSLLRQGEILELEKAIKETIQTGIENDKKLFVLINCNDVFHDEVNNNLPRTIFDYSTDIDELYKHYTKTKLWLRRIEFDMPKEYVDEFYEYCEYNGVSVWLINKMISKSIVYKKKVCLKLAELYGDKKGTDSLEYVYYTLLGKSMEDSVNGN